MAEKSAAAPLVPTGVYLNACRNNAIVVKSKGVNVWYLTMETGKITLECCSAERFLHNFNLRLPDYPVLRAVRKYKDSLLSCDEQSERVIKVLLRGDTHLA